MTGGTDETIVLDANEFMPNRVEVDLRKLGLDIMSATWGDAEHETFMVRQELGEIPANSHPPNRHVELVLRARKTGAEDLADVLTRLQQKVGVINRKHGWVKRVLDSKGGFKVPVGAVVYKAVLGGVEGWMMAHRTVAHEITLILEISPYFYSTEETLAATAKSETGTARGVSYEVANTGGSAPGLRRIVVKNLDASTDWKGFLWAEQCDDLVAGAADTYEAEGLTLLNASAKAAKAESTTEAVKNEFVRGAWMNVLGTGALTHQGVKRIWLRALAEVAGLEFQLVWRPLGSPQWYENDPVLVPITESWMLLDLGEIRVNPPIIGEQKWEGFIRARTSAAVATAWMDRVAILPTEQYTLVTEPSTVVLASSVKTKAPGVDGAEWGESEYTWADKANIKARDSANASCLVTYTQSTPVLYSGTHGIVLPAGAVVTGIGVAITKKATAYGMHYLYDKEVTLFKAGAPAGGNRAKPEIWPTTLQTISYGGPEDLWDTTWTKAQVEAAGFGAGIQVAATSEVGEMYAYIDCIEISVYYYVPAEVADETKACFAGREAQVRSDGVFRQHKSSNVWGQLPFIGFLPYSVPSGLESLPCRGIIIPSAGDFSTWPDSGSGHKLSVSVYTRNAYHFASEAS